MKVILFSLKTDGYLYYKKLMPTFHEELALAIGEKPNIIKELLTYLTEFDMLEKVDENTFFIKIVDDCVGSETDSAKRMRLSRASHCDKNVQLCSPEKEIEKEKEIELEKIREERTVSTFSSGKKSENTPSFQNRKNNSEKKLTYSYLNNKAPRNKEMEEYLNRMINTELKYTPKKE